MLTWLDVDSTQDIVHASQLNRLTIDGGCPSRIVDLREDEYTTLARVNIIGKMIWLVAGDLHDAGGILYSSLTQL